MNATPQKPAAIFKLATHFDLSSEQADKLRELLSASNRDGLKGFMKALMEEVRQKKLENTPANDPDLQRFVDWVLKAFDEPGHLGHWPRINFVIEEDYNLS